MNLTKQEREHLAATMTPPEIKSYVQDLGYRAWKDAGRRGTEQCATGIGKTRIGIRAVHEELLIDPDALIYICVPTETLRDKDWPAEMQEMGHEYLIDHPNVIRICWASLPKIRPTRDVSLFVGDEIHHFTPLCGPFFNSDDYKVFHIMGLTATLPDPKGPEEERERRILIDQYCPSVFVVTLEEAIELRLVADFEVYVMLFDLDDTVKYITVGPKGKQHMVTELQQYKLLTKVLQRAMYIKSKEGLKFMAIQRRTEFIKNTRSKELLSKEIMEEILPGKRTLIFCGSIEQSKRLCGENVYNSLTDDSKLDAFISNEIPYLGAVDALNEGKNISDLDQSLVNQLSSKELAIIQRIGRNIRFREGHIGRIIVLVTRGTADEKWYRNAFRNFNKSRIKEYHVKLKGSVAVPA